MIRILHTADWHLGKKLEHISRFEEQKAAMEEICAIADREKPDLVIVAGNLFDQFNPPIEAQDLLYKTLKRLSDDGRRPVLAIAGNHDSPDRIDSVDPLARYNGIFFTGYPHTVVPTIDIDRGWRISNSDAGFLEFRWDKLGFPVRVLHTAFPNEFRLKTMLQGEDNPGLAGFLHAHWQTLADTWCDDQGVQILTSHLFASLERPHYEEEDGERATLSVGGAQVIFPEQFPAKIDYVALGHLHRPHAVAPHTPHIVYSGSPLAYSFAEAGQQKVVVMVELAPGKKADIRKIGLQSGRPLLKHTADSLAAAETFLQENHDAIVDLTVVVEEYMDPADRRKLTQLNPHVFIRPLSKRVQQEQQRQANRYATGNMEDHFRLFFEEKNSLAPSEEIMQLFREILATEPDNQ